MPIGNRFGKYRTVRVSPSRTVTWGRPSASIRSKVVKCAVSSSTVPSHTKGRILDDSVEHHQADFARCASAAIVRRHHLHVEGVVASFDVVLDTYVRAL